MFSDQLARFEWTKWHLNFCSAWPDVCALPKHPFLSVQAWKGIRNSLQTCLFWGRIKESDWHLLISSSQPQKQLCIVPGMWIFHCRNLLLVELKTKKIQAGFAQICLNKKRKERCGNSDRNVNTFMQNYTPSEVWQPWEKMWKNFDKSWAHSFCKSSISPYPGSPHVPFHWFSLIFGVFFGFGGWFMRSPCSFKDILGRESKKSN